ncbi:MAG: DUF1131 domain-containing protein [Hyphomicrobiales bacterium]|mgnify:CR=1 FL=1|nr:MAG: DUF1131 domain-containing protein [Hyphomicrobiales bacterium]
MRIKTARGFAIAFLLSAATACSSGTGDKFSGIDNTISGNPFSPDSPYTGADYELPLPEIAFVMSAEAAGPLGSTPAYSSAEVKSRMPGYETVTAETALEDKVYPTLAVLKDGQQVLQLFKGSDGRAREVHAVSGIVGGPAGEQVGMTFRRAGMKRSDCRVGRNLWRGMAVCPSRKASNVQLVFALPGYRGPFTQMPSEKMIGDATLQRMVWKPR